MYETAILKLWNFSGGDIILDYEFLFSILNAFTDEYLHKVCFKVNDAKGLQKYFTSLQNIFANSFFLYTIKEWNKLGLEIYKNNTK